MSNQIESNDSDSYHSILSNDELIFFYTYTKVLRSKIKEEIKKIMDSTEINSCEKVIFLF